VRLTDAARNDTLAHLLQLLEAKAVVLTHVIRTLELAEPSVRRLLEVALAKVRSGPDARHAADAHAAEVDHPCVTTAMHARELAVQFVRGTHTDRHVTGHTAQRQR
jgi:hypothetical protein